MLFMLITIATGIIVPKRVKKIHEIIFTILMGMALSFVILSLIPDFINKITYVCDYTIFLFFENSQYLLYFCLIAFGSGFMGRYFLNGLSIKLVQKPYMFIIHRCQLFFWLFLIGMFMNISSILKPLGALFFGVTAILFFILDFSLHQRQSLRPYQTIDTFFSALAIFLGWVVSLIFSLNNFNLYGILFISFFAGNFFQLICLLMEKLRQKLIVGFYISFIGFSMLIGWYNYSFHGQKTEIQTLIEQHMEKNIPKDDKFYSVEDLDFSELFDDSTEQENYPFEKDNEKQKVFRL